MAAALRPATPTDLDAINAVIERAVMTWNLPHRVKRLTLPSYRYNAHDLDHLHMVLAGDAGHAVLGVAAWEPAQARATCRRARPACCCMACMSIRSASAPVSAAACWMPPSQPRANRDSTACW